MVTLPRTMHGFVLPGGATWNIIHHVQSMLVVILAPFGFWILPSHPSRQTACCSFSVGSKPAGLPTLSFHWQTPHSRQAPCWQHCSVRLFNSYIHSRKECPINYARCYIAVVNLDLVSSNSLMRLVLNKYAVRLVIWPRTVILNKCNVTVK